MHIEEQQNEAKREQMDYYLNFVAMLNANKPESKEESKKLEKFMQSIRPVVGKQKKKVSKPKWNKRVQEKIARNQQLEYKGD